MSSGVSLKTRIYHSASFEFTSCKTLRHPSFGRANGSPFPITDKCFSRRACLVNAASGIKANNKLVDFASHDYPNDIPEQ